MNVAITPNSMSVLHFMECLAEQGFSYAGAYLEETHGCKVLILDPQGRLLYPSDYPAAETFPQDIPNIQDNATPWLYRAPDKLLVFPLPSQEAYGTIALSPIAEDAVAAVVEQLEQVAAPLAYHLTSYRFSQRKLKSLSQDTSDQLFAQGGKKLIEYLQLHGQVLDSGQTYFVTVTRISNAEAVYDWATTTESVARYLRENGAEDVLDIGITEGFIHIFPSDYALDQKDCKKPHRKFYDLEHHKAVHDKKKGMITSIGVGRSYPFSALESSYREANTALELGWLMGKENEIIRYSRLGIFEFLLDTNHDALLVYCQEALRGVLDFEAGNDTPLLSTLRLMLDYSFHWVNVSKLLFIHVNTLHYRMDKISRLLDVDFSQQATRANYYIVLKLYDLLNARVEPVMA